MSNTTSANTTIADLTEGTYTFRLTVTDNTGATATDDVEVIVHAALNMPPVVNAGEDVVSKLTPKQRFAYGIRLR